MAGEEQAEDDLFGDDVGVEGHLQGFGVAGHAGADLAVAGVVGVSACVAGDHFSHAGGPLVDGVEAPEAAGAEGEGMKIAHNPYNDDTLRLFPAPAVRSVAIGSKGQLIGRGPRRQHGRLFFLVDDLEAAPIARIV